MTFPRYSKYQDSGLEWLGDIPEHWGRVPLYAVARERSESNRGMIEENLLSLSYGRIVRKDAASNDGLLPESFETYQVVSPGDIVLRLTDLQNDKRSLRSALVEERGIITSAYVALSPCCIVPRYLSYLLRAYDSTKVLYSMGGGLRQSIKFADIKRLCILLPPQCEQAAITSFLDGETAKIDALVGEQQRLVDLLKEKRQTIISRAVTRGMNPKAPTKSSGVEWVGDVPAHWDLAKLGRLLKSPPCYGVLVPDFEPNGVPMLRITDMERGRADRASLTTISHPLSAQYSRTVLEAGDVALSVVGTIGEALKVDAELAGANLSRAVARLQLSEGLDADFLIAIFGSCPFRQFVDLTCVGTAQRVLNMSDLVQYRVAVPPVEEQLQITHFLEGKLQELDGLIKAAERAIALLRERRTALISAAVTGKIDVRGCADVNEAA